MEVVAAFDLSLEPSRDQVLRTGLPSAAGADRQREIEMQLKLEQRLISMVDNEAPSIVLNASLEDAGTKLRDYYAKLTKLELDSRLLRNVDGRDAKQIGWQDKLVWRLEIERPATSANVVDQY